MDAPLWQWGLFPLAGTTASEALAWPSGTSFHKRALGDLSALVDAALPSQWVKGSAHSKPHLQTELRLPGTRAWPVCSACWNDKKPSISSDASNGCLQKERGTNKQISLTWALSCLIICILVNLADSSQLNFASLAKEAAVPRS